MNTINKALLDNIKQVNLKDEERYIIENSKDNKKVIRISKDNKLIYLGSKYSVTRDIETFKDNINNIELNGTIIVWGLGTGEHILELLKDKSFKKKIIVIEPDEKVLIENTLSNNIGEILESEKVTIVLYNKENIKGFLSKCINETEINTVQILPYANCDKVYDSEYKEFGKEFIEFVSSLMISINTSLHFTKQFFKCFVRNIKKIVDSIILNNFKNKFDKMPAIIVSAGPSLEKNIHLLKDVQDRFIIITGGRTLNALLEKGIKPDFVCSIDPGDASYEVIKKSLHSDVPLVFSEVSNYKIVEEYAGKKIFFQDIDFKDVTDDLIGVNVDSLWQGGSVAHVCISLAAYLGCNRIILIGQDLAYTNNKYHAEIANISSNNSIAKDDNYIYVEDIHGERVLTTKVLDFYRKKIERMIEDYQGITFVNSTEGGANIKGTLVKTLKQSISEYSSDTVINKNVDYLLNKKSIIDKKLVYKNINKILTSIKNIEKICEKGLIYTSRMYKYYDKNILLDINYILGQLDKIDDKLNREIEKTQSIKKLYAPLVARIMISDEFREKEGETAKEKGKRLALKTETIYKGLLEVMKEAKVEFKEALDDLVIEN